jgi:O-antigen ligase
VLAAAFAAAAAIPTLLAYSVPPSTTALNQLLAVGLWGLAAWAAVVLPVGPALATLSTPAPRGGEGAGHLVRAAALPLAVALCALGSWVVHPLPRSLATTTLALLMAAATMAAAGAWTARRADGAQVFGAVGAGWALAGLGCAVVAVVQVFAPPATESWWIARSSIPGRAVSNLRQPNHLATVLLWALVGWAAWLHLRQGPDRGKQEATAPASQAGRARVQPAQTLAGLTFVALLMLALVLSGSRTGLVGVVLLAVWGLLDRGLCRSARLQLAAAPLLAAAAWAGVSWWSASQGVVIGAQQRLSEGDMSASRLGIWSDTWALIQQHPWTGVGWGQFNFAWSLSAFPNRHVAFFDHTHNLPLQWAVEVGLPATALLLALALRGLWSAWRRSRGAGTADAAGRCAVMLVLVVGLHSLLEYPLWYAHFLLPAAFAWGYAQALGASAATAPAPAPATATARPGQRMTAHALATACLLCALGAAFAAQDYLRVVQVFQSWPDAPPLAERIDDGRHSVFFAHHAHYAAATTSALPPAQRRDAFDVASRHILDTRLMIAWAKAFEQAGDHDRALHLAQRLREFRNPAARSFFAPCTPPAQAADTVTPAPAFPCGQPARALGWQDFLPPR